MIYLRKTSNGQQVSVVEVNFCDLHAKCRVKKVFDILNSLLAFMVMYMSHFSYSCKMWYPLNLVLENLEYLWFY